MKKAVKAVLLSLVIMLMMGVGVQAKGVYDIECKSPVGESTQTVRESFVSGETITVKMNSGQILNVRMNKKISVKSKNKMIARGEKRAQTRFRIRAGLPGTSVITVRSSGKTMKFKVTVTEYEEEEVLYMVNKRNGKVHIYKGCWTQPEDYELFETEEDLEEAGYDMCNYCHNCWRYR